MPTGVALEEGRIVATHRRSFGPVPADGLRVEPYDPTYYVEYTLAGPVELPGGCDHTPSASPISTRRSAPSAR